MRLLRELTLVQVQSFLMWLAYRAQIVRTGSGGYVVLERYAMGRKESIGDIEGCEGVVEVNEAVCQGGFGGVMGWGGLGACGQLIIECHCS